MAAMYNLTTSHKERIVIFFLKPHCSYTLFQCQESVIINIKKAGEKASFHLTQFLLNFNTLYITTYTCDCVHKIYVQHHIMDVSLMPLISACLQYYETSSETAEHMWIIIDFYGLLCFAARCTEIKGQSLPRWLHGDEYFWFFF